MNIEGLNIYARDIINVVEKEFPAIFGGTSLDYQVVIRENDEGVSKVFIYINPELKSIGKDEVMKILYNNITENDDSARKRMFNSLKTVVIERRKPLVTSRGKQLPFLFR
jgi:hypothetical protein